MQKNIYSGFTLIEIVVSISILSIIMMSVFMIFSLSADLNNKTDISRSLQENIKNIEQVLSEDIKNNKITGVNSDVVLSNCTISSEGKFSTGTKLCLGSHSYFLAKKVADTWVRIGNNEECDGKNICSLVQDNGVDITPLSNSWVDFKNLVFTLSHTPIQKVSIQFMLQPSAKKGVKRNLIEQNEVFFQTTISEKLYNNN